MSTQLRDLLEQHLDAVVAPPGDLARSRREGTARRRRRHVLVGVTTVGVVLTGVLGLSRVVDDAVDQVTAPDYPALGRMDFSDGLRAYADPGVEVHLGGRTFPAQDLEFLDTDAAATPYGIVFYDDGRPLVLREDGEVVALADGPVEWTEDWHPGAKADSVTPQVAFATLSQGVATITVRDLQSNRDVATLDVECGRCGDLRIDALDGGALFYRTGTSTMIWEVGEAGPEPFAGERTTVADARNGVLLYDGPEPETAAARAWRMMASPVDSQLTHDGEYVVGRSSVLQPTQRGREPARLSEGPVKGLGFWTVDTDGTVLVAALTGAYPRYTVFDCAVPSGECEEVGPLVTHGGDPMFIGNDM